MKDRKGRGKETFEKLLKEKQVKKLVDINIHHLEADSDTAAYIYLKKNNRHNPNRRCTIYINYILIQIN